MKRLARVTKQRDELQAEIRAILERCLTVLAEQPGGDEEPPPEYGHAEPAPAGWISMEEALPPIDVPVFLHEPGFSSTLLVGCRCETAEGWCWASVSCSSTWHDGARWIAAQVDLEDLSPSHWMPLPDPPRDEMPSKQVTA